MTVRVFSTKPALRPRSGAASKSAPLRATGRVLPFVSPALRAGSSGGPGLTPLGSAHTQDCARVRLPARTATGMALPHPGHRNYRGFGACDLASPTSTAPFRTGERPIPLRARHGTAVAREIRRRQGPGICDAKGPRGRPSPRVRCSSKGYRRRPSL